MKVTLYSQNRLDKAYTNVFYTQEIINAYLSKITNKVEFTIDEFYALLNDELFLSGYATNLTEVAQYNYIVFTPEDNEAKGIIYAFIDGIQAQNDGFIITYSVDVWHTFLPTESYQLTRSIITNSMYPEEYISINLRYTTPIEYAQYGVTKNDSANGVYFSPVFKSQIDGKINLFAKLQVYKLDEAGEATGIEVKFVGFTRSDGVDTPQADFYLGSFTLAETQKLIDSVSRNMNTSGIFGDGKFYRVVNLYALESGVYDNDTTNRVLDEKTGYIIEQKVFGDDAVTQSLGCRQLRTLNITSSNDYKGQILKTKVIYRSDLKNDYYKITGLGLYNRILPFDNTIPYNVITVRAVTNGLFLRILLEVNNILTDITDDCVCDLNFNVADAAAMQLQEMHKTINENNAKQSAIDYSVAATNVVAETAKTTFGVMSSFSQVGDALSKGKIGAASKGLFGGINRAISGAQSTVAYKARAEQAKIEQENYELRANQKYLNWSNTANRQGGFINAMYGFVMQVGNMFDDDITGSVEQYGYKIINGYYKKTNLPDLSKKGKKFDYVKFGLANVMHLTGDYAEVIKTILESGVYIYYDSD